MLETCFRCEASEAVLQCADCPNDDGSLVLFCDECSLLVHIGKFSRHRLTSVLMKEKKVETEAKLVNYQRDINVVNHKLQELNYLDKDLQETYRLHERNIRCRVIELQEDLKKRAMDLIRDVQEYVKDKSQAITEAREALVKQRDAMKQCKGEIQEILNLDDSSFAQKAKDEDCMIYEQWTSPDLKEIKTPSIFMEVCVDFGEVAAHIANLRVNIKDLENKPNLKLDGPKFEPGEEFEVMLCSSLQRNGTFSVSPMFRDDSIITLNQLGVEIRSELLKDLSWRTYADLDVLPKEGESVCAQHPTDNKWYRAKVLNAAKTPKNEINVMFVDYGNLVLLPTDRLVPSRDVAPQCGNQAMICTPFSSIKVTIHPEATWVFHDYTKNCRLFCKLGSLLEQSVWHVELYSRSGEGSEKLLVNDKLAELVSEGSEDKPTIGCRDIRYQHVKTNVVMVETKESPSRPTQKTDALAEENPSTSPAMENQTSSEEDKNEAATTKNQTSENHVKDSSAVEKVTESGIVEGQGKISAVELNTLACSTADGCPDTGLDGIVAHTESTEKRDLPDEVECGDGDGCAAEGVDQLAVTTGSDLVTDSAIILVVKSGDEEVVPQGEVTVVGDQSSADGAISTPDVAVTLPEKADLGSVEEGTNLTGDDLSIEETQNKEKDEVKISSSDEMECESQELEDDSQNCGNTAVAQPPCVTGGHCETVCGKEEFVEDVTDLQKNEEYQCSDSGKSNDCCDAGTHPEPQQECAPVTSETANREAIDQQLTNQQVARDLVANVLDAVQDMALDQMAQKEIKDELCSNEQQVAPESVAENSGEECAIVTSLVTEDTAEVAAGEVSDAVEVDETPDSAACSGDKQLDTTVSTDTQPLTVEDEQCSVNDGCEEPGPALGSVNPAGMSVSPDNDSVDPDNELVGPDNDSISPDNESVSPDNASVSPDNASVSPDNESVSSDNESVSPDKESVSPDKESVSPDKESVSPDKESVSPDKESVTACSAIPNSVGTPSSGNTTSGQVVSGAPVSASDKDLGKVCQYVPPPPPPTEYIPPSPPAAEVRLALQHSTGPPASDSTQGPYSVSTSNSQEDHKTSSSDLCNIEALETQSVASSADSLLENGTIPSTGAGDGTIPSTGARDGTIPSTGASHGSPRTVVSTACGRLQAEAYEATADLKPDNSHCAGKIVVPCQAVSDSQSHCKPVLTGSPGKARNSRASRESERTSTGGSGCVEGASSPARSVSDSEPVSTQSMPGTALQQLIDNLPSPDSKNEFRGHLVSDLDSEGKFWLKLNGQNKKEQDAISSLTNNIQICGPLMTTIDDPAPGAMVLLRHKDLWQRASINEIQANKAIVFLVDLGLQVSVPISSLKSVHKSIEKLPRQAVQCCIANHSYSNFSPPISKMFTDLCKAKELQAHVVQMSTDARRNSFYYVRLFAPISGTLMNVYDMLWEKGLMNYPPATYSDANTSSIPVMSQPPPNYMPSQHYYIPRVPVPMYREGSPVYSDGSPVYLDRSPAYTEGGQVFTEVGQMERSHQLMMQAMADPQAQALIDLAQMMQDQGRLGDQGRFRAGSGDYVQGVEAVPGHGHQPAHSRPPDVQHRAVSEGQPPVIYATQQRPQTHHTQHHPERHPSESQRYPSESQRYPSETQRHPSEPQRQPSETQRHPSEPQRHLYEPQRHPSEPQQHPYEPQRQPSETQRHLYEPQQHPYEPQRHPSETQRHPSETQRHLYEPHTQQSLSRNMDYTHQASRTEPMHSESSEYEAPSVSSQPSRSSQHEHSATRSDRNQPRSSDRGQPRSINYIHPRSQDRDHSRSLDRTQPRSSDCDQPRSSDCDQPRSSDHDQPRSSDRDQPRSSDHDQPRSSDRDQTRSSDRDQPRSSDRDQPRSSDRDQLRSSDRDQPRSSDHDQPRSSASDQTRSSDRDHRPDSAGAGAADRSQPYQWTATSSGRTKNLDLQSSSSQPTILPESAPANQESAFDEGAWLEDESDTIAVPKVWKADAPNSRSRPVQGQHHHNGQSRSPVRSSQGSNAGDVKCFYCHGHGHIAGNCPKKAPPRMQPKRNTQRQSNQM